jgi:hypothetical protein
VSSEGGRVDDAATLIHDPASVAVAAVGLGLIELIGRPSGLHTAPKADGSWNLQNYY